MNSQQLSTFNFNSSTLRVIDLKGSPWFVAADVCRSLGMSIMKNGKPNVSDAISKLLPEERGIERIDTPEYPTSPWQRMIVVSESGLYKLIMRSDKPEARAFQDWVTKVVLPAIRKDGAYVVGEEKVASGELSEDEFVLRAISILQGKVERLKQENLQLSTEKVAVTHERDGLASTVGKHQHTVVRFARTLPGVNTMRVKGRLMELNYLYRIGGAYRVYAKYRDMFPERICSEGGYVDIFVSEKGKTLLASLYSQGELPMKVGFAKGAA